jgi:predicted ATPase
MFLKRLTLKKLLSFNDTTVELLPLNILIGPNAVGKSNLIEAIGLLQAAPSSIAAAILRGGGIRQWLWLGDRVPPIATIECELMLSRGPQTGQIIYQLQLSAENGFAIPQELVREPDLTDGKGEAYLTRFFNSAEYGPAAFRAGTPLFSRLGMGMPPSESILSQFKNPADITPITQLGSHFGQIRIFREFRTTPGAQARIGVPTNIAKDMLQDGGDNLALVLHELDFLGVHERIRSYLSRFCERFEDVKIRLGEGLAQIHLREGGLTEMLSAIRMSDGTLKFLALLAALFHPQPPPLMCIEEPEVGLHPDALQLVAEALLEASESMQLIVTTHSDALVDSLTERPETVLVCDRDFDNGTQMKRLSKEDLKGWLQDYSLGQLWRKGEIGGRIG